MFTRLSYQIARTIQKALPKCVFDRTTVKWQSCYLNEYMNCGDGSCGGGFGSAGVERFRTASKSRRDNLQTKRH
jgi:hypothetical protein